MSTPLHFSEPCRATTTLLEILRNNLSPKEKELLSELEVLQNKSKDSPAPEIFKKIAEIELALFEIDGQTKSSLSLEKFVFYVLHQPILEESDIQIFQHIMAKDQRAIDWKKQIEMCFETFGFSLTKEEVNAKVYDFLEKIGPFSSTCELVKNLYKSTDKVGFTFNHINPHSIESTVNSQKIEPNDLFRMLAYAIFFDLNHPVFDEVKLNSLTLLIACHTKSFPKNPPFFTMDDSFLSCISDCTILTLIYVNYYRNIDPIERTTLMKGHPFLKYWIGEENSYFVYAKATFDLEKIEESERTEQVLLNYINLMTAIISKLLSHPPKVILLTHLFYELFQFLGEKSRYILINVLWGKNNTNTPDIKIANARLFLAILYSINNVSPSFLLEDFILEILTDLEVPILNKIHQVKREKNLPALLNLADKLILDFEHYRELKNHVGCSVSTFTNIFAIFKVLTEIDVELCEPLILVIEMVFERLNLEKSDSKNELIVDIRKIYIEYIEINLQALKKQLLSIPLSISISELEHRSDLLSKCQIKISEHELPPPASMKEVSFLISTIKIYLDSSLSLEQIESKINKSLAKEKKLKGHFSQLIKVRKKEIDKTKPLKIFNIQGTLSILNERKHWNSQYISLLKQVLKYAFQELSDKEFEKYLIDIIQTIMKLDELTFSLDYVQTAFKQNRFDNQKKRELFLKELAPYLVKKVNTISLEDQLALLREQETSLKQNFEVEPLTNSSCTLTLEDLKSFTTIELGHESQVQRSDYTEFYHQLQSYIQNFSFTKYSKMMNYLFEKTRDLGFEYIPETNSIDGDHVTYRLAYLPGKLIFGVATIPKKNDMPPIYQMDCFKKAITYPLKIRKLLMAQNIIK